MQRSRNHERSAVVVLHRNPDVLVFHVYLRAGFAALRGFARRFLQNDRPGDRVLWHYPAFAAGTAGHIVRPLAQTQAVCRAGDGRVLCERAGDVVAAGCGGPAVFPWSVRSRGDRLGRARRFVQQLFFGSRGATGLRDHELAGVLWSDGRHVYRRAGCRVVWPDGHLHPGCGGSGGRAAFVAGGQGKCAGGQSAAAAGPGARHHAQFPPAGGGGAGEFGAADRLRLIIWFCAGGGKKSGRFQF